MNGAGRLRRDVVVLMCAISAGVHAALAPAHLDESTAAGAGFVAAAAALAFVGVAMNRSARAVVPAAAALVFSGLIVSYVLATTTGVPVLQPEPEAVDTVALATKAFEILGLLASSSLVLGRALAGVSGRRVVPLFLPVLIAAFSGLAALAASSGHAMHAHHHGDADARRHAHQHAPES